ncbi:hypothetical protein ACN38_g3159 [Penicillium nordicum]|uniref:Tat pathway signal sequence n=1 Tax=Penicillium nordicum TaxID=229535 RepID=A0A0M8P5I6_9EURO|nr:hypothetical protein ACN38_g3159 [Penicillium nordicum]
MPVPESSSALPVYSPIPSLEKPPHDPYRADAGERLSQHDSEESENDPFLFDGFRVPLRRHLHWLQRYGRLGAEVLLVLLNLCLLAYLVFKPQVPLLLRQKECGRLLGRWLPGWEDGVEYEVQRFKGSFGIMNEFTGYGPGVDAAWDNITDGPTGGAIGITKEQWEAVNQFHDFPVMLDHDYGNGQYLASLDVFHQLHCVDLLRKNIHREYYDKHEGSFAGAPPRVIEGHLEHCVETLRQTLMCHADISLLTYNWVEGRNMPYPNFNTIHTCKRWDKLIEWKSTLDVTGEWKDGNLIKEYQPPTKPEGVVGMKVPP